MGLLDDSPFQPELASARSLLERLTALAGTAAAARAIILPTGILEAEVKWDVPMIDLWPVVLPLAADRRLLRPLVKVASDKYPAEPVFVRLLSEPPGAGAAAPEDAWLTPHLWMTHSMIDRAPLREALQGMKGVQGRRTLLVVGKKNTGTSHARRFLTYLKEVRSLTRVHVIDNSLWAGTPITVRELAHKIAWAVARQDAPTFDSAAQPDSVASQFIGWFSGVISAIDEPLWLVFDGFAAESAAAPALKLINDLATLAADYSLGPVRVVVCGYEGPAPIYAGAVTESVQSPTEADVKQFFTRMSEALTGTASDEAAIDVLYEKFVADEGAVEGRPITELGPSALAYATRVYGPVPV